MNNFNFLPWREEARVVRQKVFFGVLIGSLLSILGSTILVHVNLAYCIHHQQMRNMFLSGRLDQLKKQISTTDALIAEKQRILNRIATLHNLLSSSSEIFTLMTELGHLIPKGVQLRGVKREGNTLWLNGNAESNNPITTMLRAMEKSTLVKEVMLNEIKNEQAKNNFEGHSFLIMVRLQQSNEI